MPSAMSLGKGFWINKRRTEVFQITRRQYKHRFEGRSLKLNTVAIRTA
jgi:hypothetical protein